MNLVISVPKTGKAYNKKLENPVFLNKKIGEEVSLSEIGLNDCKAVIMGGSDKDGFPMKTTISGTGRRKVFLSQGVGFKGTREGERIRRTIRGNTVGEDIHQLNLKVTEAGKQDLEKVLGKTAEGEAKEEGAEKKEETPKEGKEKETPKEEGKEEKAEEKGKEVKKDEGKKEEKKGEKKEGKGKEEKPAEEKAEGKGEKGKEGVKEEASKEEKKEGKEEKAEEKKEGKK